VSNAARVVDPDLLLLVVLVDVKRLGLRRVSLAARLDDDRELTLMGTNDLTTGVTTEHQ
jgi:hypothetical protein